MQTNVYNPGITGCALLNDLDKLLSDKIIVKLLSLITKTEKKEAGQCIESIDMRLSADAVREFVEKHQYVLEQQRVDILHWLNCVFICQIMSRRWWTITIKITKSLCVLALFLERMYNEKPRTDGTTKQCTIENLPCSIIYVYDYCQHFISKEAKEEFERHKNYCLQYETTFTRFYTHDDHEELSNGYT